MSRVCWNVEQMFYFSWYIVAFVDFKANIWSFVKNSNHFLTKVTENIEIFAFSMWKFDQFLHFKLNNLTFEEVSKTFGLKFLTDPIFTKDAFVKCKNNLL